MSIVQEKKEKFHSQLVSAEKRKFFEDTRRKMMEAQKNDRKEEEWEAEIEMMRMFKTREEYEHTLKMFDEYEREKEEWQEYLEKVEEESVNY